MQPTKFQKELNEGYEGKQRIKSDSEVFGWGDGNDILALFFFNDTATTEIYTLSLHDALPIC